MQKRTVYAVRNDRLGGRLGAMLNAMRIAESYDMNFRFTWADHADVSDELQNPSALFTEEFLHDHRETEKSYSELNNNIRGIEIVLDGATPEEFVANLRQDDVRVHESMRVLHLHREDPKIVANQVVETLRKIDFNVEVKDAMREMDERMGDDRLVAYHMRRGDIIDPEARASNSLWPTKYVPQVYYEEHISLLLAQHPNARVVIFSDAPHAVKALCSISDLVLSAQDMIPDFLSDQLQLDFMESYAMSRCHQIIAPGASAFSRVAAMMGNCEIIPIVDSLSKEDRANALDRMTRQLDHEPDAFAGDADIGQNFQPLIDYQKEKGTPEVARAILQKHRDRGFEKPYIHDLLAEQHFLAGDMDAVLDLVYSLDEWPVYTDLGAARSYTLGGFAAMIKGDRKAALNFAHIANWLQPIWPITRLLIGSIYGQRHDPNETYPVAGEFILRKDMMMPNFQHIIDKIPAPRNPKTGRAILTFIPFELDVRDWSDIQSTRLPPQFWNVAAGKKKIQFMNSMYSKLLNRPTLRSLIGQFHCQIDDTETGDQMIRDAYLHAPNDPLIVLRMARRFRAYEEYDSALELYETAAKLSNQQICFQAEYGVALLEARKKPKALNIFKEIAKTDHTLIELHILTADVLRRSKKTRPLALKVASRVDAIVPGAKRTAQVHRKVLEQMGRKDEAEEIRQQFVEWKRPPGKFSSRISIPD